MLQNLGEPNVDYQAFKSSYDKDPQKYKNLIKRFDDKGITIRTNLDADKSSVGTGDKTSSIDSAAKRAAAKTLKK